MIKLGHAPQEGGNGWVIAVRYFSVVHETVNNASERVLQGRRAVKLASVADRGDWGESRMNGVGPHYPVDFSPN
jgi:hypothetical protein